MNKVRQLTPTQSNGSSQPQNIDLWEFHLYYKQMAAPLKFLLRSRINDFYKENLGRISTIESEIGKIQAEQFEMENGIVKIKEPLLDSNGEPVNPNAEPMPLYKSGFDDSTFQAAFNKLMSLPTTIA